MKIPEIWHFVCLVFGVFSLDTLVEESHEVIYEEKNETGDFQYLACTELNWIPDLNKTIDLEKLRDDLCSRFNSSIDSFWRRYNPRMFEKLALNQTKLGSYLILNGKICFTANDRKELEDIDGFFSPKAELFAIEKNTFDFFRMNYPEDQIDQLTVLKKPHPYSDCDQSNRRFYCLNDCFRRSSRLARYFYHSNETGTIQLNYSDRNETIKENEKICFENCGRENCKMNQLISNSWVKNPKTEKFEAQPKLSEFDYWRQFIGLVCSFAGLSLHELTTIAIEFIASKVRRKVKIGLFYLKWSILFLSLASFGYLKIQTIIRHQDTRSNLIEKETRYFVQPKIIQFAICVDLKGYANKTMMEIEKKTDGALVDALGSTQLIGRNRSEPNTKFSLKYCSRETTGAFSCRPTRIIRLHPQNQNWKSN